MIRRSMAWAGIALVAAMLLLASPVPAQDGTGAAGPQDRGPSCKPHWVHLVEAGGQDEIALTLSSAGVGTEGAPSDREGAEPPKEDQTGNVTASIEMLGRRLVEGIGPYPPNTEVRVWMGPPEGGLAAQATRNLSQKEQWRFEPKHGEAQCLMLGFGPEGKQDRVAVLVLPTSLFVTTGPDCSSADPEAPLSPGPSLSVCADLGDGAPQVAVEADPSWRLERPNPVKRADVRHPYTQAEHVVSDRFMPVLRAPVLRILDEDAAQVVLDNKPKLEQLEAALAASDSLVGAMDRLEESSDATEARAAYEQSRQPLDLARATVSLLGTGAGAAVDELERRVRDAALRHIGPVPFHLSADTTCLDRPLRPGAETLVLCEVKEGRPESVETRCPSGEVKVGQTLPPCFLEGHALRTLVEEQPQLARVRTPLVSFQVGAEVRLLPVADGANDAAILSLLSGLADHWSNLTALRSKEVGAPEGEILDALQATLVKAVEVEHLMAQTIAPVPSRDAAVQDLQEEPLKAANSKMAPHLGQSRLTALAALVVAGLATGSVSTLGLWKLGEREQRRAHFTRQGEGKTVMMAAGVLVVGVVLLLVSALVGDAVRFLAFAFGGAA